MASVPHIAYAMPIHMVKPALYSINIQLDEETIQLMSVTYTTKLFNPYVTRHDILCPNAVKRDVGKTRCKSDVILRNCTLLRNLLSGIC